jgi:CheY-like chemotaxis protein
VKGKPRILVVDDDPEIAKMLSRSLSRRGYQIEAIATADEALAKSAAEPYDAAILDLVMPGRDGADLAAALRAQSPGLPIALLTGYSRSPLLEGAERQPATAVFTKPVAIADLADFLQAELAGE